MSMIWATRGRQWGFRFLRAAGFSDPLPIYESAFSSVDDASQVMRRNNDVVVLRLSDPNGRRDQSGRVIPHEFVIFEPLASRVHSIDDALQEVWPLVADRFAEVWDKTEVPAIDG